MKFILLVAFLTSHYSGGTQGVSMQEFDTQQACERAGAKVVQLASALRGGKSAGQQIKWECVPDR